MRADHSRHTRAAVALHLFWPAHFRRDASAIVAAVYLVADLVPHLTPIHVVRTRGRA